jgi:vacuolar-type H+-ATPase subunit F/Vma7
LLGFVIGDNKMVTGFRLVGVEGVEVTTVDEAREALSNTLSRSDVALIMLSQQFSPQMQAEIARIRTSRVTPLIVELPGSVGPRSETKLSDQISKNLGIKI